MCIRDRSIISAPAAIKLIAAGAEIIDKPTVRDKNLISATSGEAGISDLLEMLAAAIKDNTK